MGPKIVECVLPPRTQLIKSFLVPKNMIRRTIYKVIDTSLRDDSLCILLINYHRAGTVVTEKIGEGSDVTCISMIKIHGAL